MYREKLRFSAEMHRLLSAPGVWVGARHDVNSLSKMPASLIKPASTWGAHQSQLPDSFSAREQRPTCCSASSSQVQLLVSVYTRARTSRACTCTWDQDWLQHSLYPSADVLLHSMAGHSAFDSSNVLGKAAAGYQKLIMLKRNATSPALEERKRRLCVMNTGSINGAGQKVSCTSWLLYDHSLQPCGHCGKLAQHSTRHWSARPSICTCRGSSTIPDNPESQKMAKEKESSGLHCCVSRYSAPLEILLLKPADPFCLALQYYMWIVVSTCWLLLLCKIIVSQQLWECRHTCRCGWCIDLSVLHSWSTGSGSMA